MFGAFFEGWRRVLRTPALAFSVTLALLLTSVPLAMRPGDFVGRDIESTVRNALTLVNGAWTSDRFASSSSPAAAALYAVLGPGATLAAAYILFWVFLSGGILDRLARGRPVGMAQFFASCGVYFGRFARLGLIVVAAYAVLFRIFKPQISDRAGILAFLAMLAVVNLVVDFTKVRAVVEDRRSMLGALAAAFRFIRHRPVTTVLLYSLNILTAVGLVLLWERAMPLSAMAYAPPWAVFLVAFGYLLVRVVARLAFMASEVVYFQRKLAHAEYTAAPEIVWPDSPAVEAINNLTATKEPHREGHEGREGPEGSSW